MGKKDKKVDAYIAKSAPFAGPILSRLRELVHKACPEAEESIKWGFPHFSYKGMLCSMAAFKNHCSFGFWKGALMKDPHKVMSIVGKTSMGSFDRIEDMKDLPSDKILMEYLKQAIRLNEDDVKLPARTKASEPKALLIPDYFMKALKNSKKALATFEAFSNSNKKEYLEWVTGAKTEETRARRVETAIELMAEGKVRNWKYLKK
jgi:uncharacterized protein YdeI (YjbR/CyaY-like superfamily)